MKRNPQARKPSNPIEDEINVATPNMRMWVENPERILALPWPASAREGKLWKLYEKLKAMGDSWSKVPAKDRIEFYRTQWRPKGGRDLSSVMSQVKRGIQSLASAVEDELGEIMRQLTGKTIVQDADVVLLLTTRCNLSLAEAESLPTHKAVALMSALLPVDRVPDASDKAPAAPPTYTMSAAKELTGMDSNDSINKYAGKAGISPAGRGKRNRRFTLCQMRSILDKIVECSSSEPDIAKARESLETLPEIRSKSENPKEIQHASK